MTRPDPNPARPTLRKKLRAERRSLSTSLQAAAATAVATALTDWVATLAPGIAAASVAADGELDPAPTIALLRAAGWRVAYPRVDNEDMSFHLVDRVEQMIPGRWGLVEPAGSTPMVAAAELDLVLAPLVAFDPDGNRLGRGRAYYDRAFGFLGVGPRPSRPFLVGLAHDLQRVVRLSPAAHDVRLDAVVTPSGVFGELPTD